MSTLASRPPARVYNGPDRESNEWQASAEMMCDTWLHPMDLAISLEQFHRLPRNPAYKYEYISGKAYLSPRPKHLHALLDLVPSQVSAEVTVSPMEASQFEELAPVFSSAFHATLPYGGLDDDTRLEAAKQSLERTRTGGDGPWMEYASFVARDEGRLVGAILVTLLPDVDPTSWAGFHWAEPPPADAIERGLGRPHLTWIFVAPFWARRGIGSALLRVSVNALCSKGYRQMLSTFIVGNDRSMLWHWRNGFRLLPHPGAW